MKRTAFDERRDQNIAAESYAGRDLMCLANGCPNRWSVDGGNGRLCTWHNAADAKLWPQITQEQQDNEAQRVYERQFKKPTPSRTYTADEKREILMKLRNAFAGGGTNADPKAWARILRDKEQAGERLSGRQRECWRAALGVREAA